MLVKPLGKTRRRPHCLIFPGWRSVMVIDETGVKEARGAEKCYQLLKSFEGHAAYVPANLAGLIHATGSRCWQAETWKGKATAMLLDGSRLRVSSLRRSLEGSLGPFAMFEDLSRCLEWLAEQGVSAKSVSSMSWDLYRSTVDRPFSIGFDPRIARSAFYGGRQEAKSGQTFQHMSSLDLSKAYPHSMAARPYATKLREVAKTTTIEASSAGIARARVLVPGDLAYPPLPVRIDTEVIQWQRGRLEGTWTWCELAAAMDLGAEVEILRCWAPIEEKDLFSSWFELILSAGEALPAGALVLAKTIANSLWGLFAMTGDDRGIIRWADDLGEELLEVKKGSRRQAQAGAMHIAAETTSRVRRRLLLEGLYGDTTYPVHVDTDGIIVRTSSLARRKLGTGPGEWRVKNKMTRVEVRAPQLYRFTCGKGCGLDHSRYHYVAAGMSTDQARELFERVGRPLRVSISGLDIVLPSGHAMDIEERENYLREASIVQREIHGGTLTRGRA